MTKREGDLKCLIFSSLCMWMDPCGSLVLFPPGSPVELDLCKLALLEAAFKRYQFVREWREAGVQTQQSEHCVCVRVWVCVCVERSEVRGRKGISVRYYIPQIEHSPSGSNPSIMQACWLMGTFYILAFSCVGDVTCICVFMRLG